MWRARPGGRAGSPADTGRSRAGVRDRSRRGRGRRRVMWSVSEGGPVSALVLAAATALPAGTTTYAGPGTPTQHFRRDRRGELSPQRDGRGGGRWRRARRLRAVVD